MMIVYLDLKDLNGPIKVLLLETGMGLPEFRINPIWSILVIFSDNIFSVQVLRQVTDNVEVTVSLFYIGTKENDMDNIEHNVRLSVIISIISYLVELCYSYTEFNGTNNCVTILSNCTHKYQCTDGHKSISKEF